MPETGSSLTGLRDAWRGRWEEALAHWSRYTRLFEPRWCLTVEDERREGLAESFAMIRLVDHAIVVSLRQVASRGLERFAVEILAHEVGHHVLCPADLSDQGRLLARIRAGLPTCEAEAPFVANLYADLLINDRLQRDRSLDLAGLYAALGTAGDSKLWQLYLRTYEILWGLARGSLAPAPIGDLVEGDASLAARLVRAYARDWLDGAGGFAALCLPYLLDEGAGAQSSARGRGLLDTERAGQGGEPDGLAEIEAAESAPVVHPADDPAVNDALDAPREQAAEGEREGHDAEASLEPASTGDPRERGARDRLGGRETIGGTKKLDRYRGPLEYGELLAQLGVELDAREVAARYYRERALPHVIRFPTVVRPSVADPQPEGLELWDAGSPVERIDWVESLVRSPFPIPGLTTVERTYGTTTGTSPERRPLDLYVGIDCSGSMPNPTVALSYPVLAGAILALSALRAGAKVQVVLSGEPGSATSTDGFVRAEQDVLGVLTDYLGTGYAFGIHRLAEAVEDRGPSEPPLHLLVITDQDVFSMLDGDGQTRRRRTKRKGWDVAREAVERAGGGGTYVLHMPPDWRDARVGRMRREGWHVHHLHAWEEVVSFARAFASRTYGEAA